MRDYVCVYRVFYSAETFLLYETQFYAFKWKVEAPKRLILKLIYGKNLKMMSWCLKDDKQTGFHFTGVNNYQVSKEAHLHALYNMHSFI